MMHLQRNLAIHFMFMALPLSLVAQKSPLPQLGTSPIKEVVKAMTLEEKVSLVIGTGMNFPGLPPEMQGPVVGETNNQVPGAAGTTIAIPRLGIPSIVLADGPAGLRIAPYRGNDSSITYFCTAFPIATLLASSWDTALVKRVGVAMGNEVKEYGVDILLAPALNNHRNPLGGRNFEYYSEDPLVSGKITAAMVNGVQSQGVGTSVKHFAANNHEWNRNTINVIVGQRPLREIYLRSFQIALKDSKPWTVMSSYNKINGLYTSESFDLLSTVLRNEWGFKGIVMTDWFGGTNAIAQMKAGNDLLMPGTAKQQTTLQAAVLNKELDEKVLDQNVARILSIILQTPAFKKYKFSNKPDLRGNAQIARIAAADGMVLLKNETEALPLSKGTKIAAFGHTTYNMVTGGTGSGDVNEAYTVSLVDGLKQAGYILNKSLEESYSAYIKEQLALRPKMKNPFLLPPPIAERSISTELIQTLVAENDVAIITIGRNSGEFADRKLEDDYYLSATEKELVKNVSEAFHAKGKKVVALLNIGGVIEMASWRNMVDAILLAWQPGQEAGHAIADVVSGKVNPSGKLTTTFPMDYKDVSSSKNFPGKVLEGPDKGESSAMGSAKAAEVVYEEGIYTGYRYYNTFTIAPAYEFGFGLSYTHFDYSALQLNTSNFAGKLTATITITNNGKVAGKEAVQLYLGAPAGKVDKPISELKAFAKTSLLQPGQSQKLTLTIKAEDLASFNVDRSAWIAEPGKYTLSIGASSKDIKQAATFTLPKEIIVEKVNKVLKPEVSINEVKTAAK